MEYTKPEVVVLGDASLAIQGWKGVGHEIPGEPLLGAPDAEFDD